MKQVAVGIILNDGHVLACQRKRDARYPLKWEFPGGKLEDGESPAEAAVRELHEELEINATVDRELHRQKWEYPDGKDDSSFQVFYLLIRQFNGTPVNRAFEQIRWVTPEELSKMDILEGNREMVNILVANSTTKTAERIV